VAACVAVLVGALWIMLAPAASAVPASATPSTKSQVKDTTTKTTGAKDPATTTSKAAASAKASTGSKVSTATKAPTATRPVARVCVDEVGVLGSAVCTKVAAVLDEDERLTTDQIAVLVVETTGDETIEHYATRTFNSWGIGRADKNNGVLLLVAIDDRALRIEVGTGLESTLTDGEAEEIIYGTITPEFKSGDYRSGILAGLDAIRTQLDHPVSTRNALAGLSGSPGSAYTPPQTSSRYQYAYDSDDQEQSSSGGSAVLWIVLLVILMLSSWAWSAYRRANGYDDDGDDDDESFGSYRRSRGYRSFGSGSSRRSSGSSSRSSSRSSFGGGRSRGGGGSGSW